MPVRAKLPIGKGLSIPIAMTGMDPLPPTAVGHLWFHRGGLFFAVNEGEGYERGEDQNPQCDEDAF